MNDFYKNSYSTRGELLARIAQLETKITNALRILDEPGHEDCPWCSHARYPLRAALASETACKHGEKGFCQQCEVDKWSKSFEPGGCNHESSKNRGTERG